jgi:hypothetical protein
MSYPEGCNMTTQRHWFTATAAFALLGGNGTFAAAAAPPATTVTCEPSTPARDALHKHFQLLVAPTASFSVGAGDSASLLQPVNSAAGISYGVVYKKKWSEENESLKLQYQHSFANDVDPHAVTTLKNAFNVEAIKAQTEAFSAVREWDSAATGAEQLQVTVANTYRHAGPSIVQQAKFAPASGYHITALTPDYYFGSVFVQCPWGPTRHWDIAVSAVSGSHRTAPDAVTGATDVASKITYQISPTYTFQLNPNGSLYAALNYTNDLRYFDGFPKPVHFNDYDVGIVLTPNRNVQYELHLNSLTQTNPAQAVTAPSSFSHANIDFKMSLLGLP